MDDVALEVPVLRDPLEFSEFHCAAPLALELVSESSWIDQIGSLENVPIFFWVRMAC